MLRYIRYTKTRYIRYTKTKVYFTQTFETHYRDKTQFSSNKQELLVLA